MTPCLPFHQNRVLQHFCSGMCRNENIILDGKWLMSLDFSFFLIFVLPFLLSSFLIFLLCQWLTLLLGLFPIQKLLRKHCWDRQLLLKFQSIFIHTCILDSSEPLTLIWVSLERSFLPTDVEYRRCEFCSNVMMSEVEQRPRLTTGSYGQKRSQWVKTTSIKYKSCTLIQNHPPSLMKILWLSFSSSSSLSFSYFSPPTFSFSLTSC